jgi:amino acid adenylation domain-containing protein
MLSKKLLLVAGQKRREQDYWINKLSGDWVKSTLSYDKTPVETKRRMDIEDFSFSDRLFDRLTKLSNGNDVKLHIVLMAGLVAFVHKYCRSGNRDIVVGTPIYKQEKQGEFVNTLLPLRNQIQESQTFKQLLLQVRESVVEGTRNQSYPMEVLISKLDIPPSETGFPLFEIAALLENIHDNSYLREVHCNIIFSFSRTAASIDGSLRYNASLYHSQTIKRITSYFSHLLQQLVFHVDEPLQSHEILPEVEKKQVLFDFNNDTALYPSETPCHHLFEEQVRKSTDTIAASFQGRHLSYRELNKRANQLARALRARGVTVDSNVAIMIDRSLEMIIGIMGILKAGGAYLPIEPGYPSERLAYILEDSGAVVLLTKTGLLENYPYTMLQNLRLTAIDPHVTVTRAQVTQLDTLPFPDRSLVNYEKYHRYIGVAPVKHNISLLGTRGCPYQCAYCHKIWPKTHVVRSAENVFEEVQVYYRFGIRRFTMIDDIFNRDVKNSSAFFRMIINNNLDVQLFFPNGLRGDVLTKDYIDLMVQAGTMGIALALESASPRLQKLIKKNLKLDKLRENIDYISREHPHVILELQTMVGFPTETEEEATMTLEFIKSLKWLHFPYLHILKIYPNTPMAKLAMGHGVSQEAIARSENLAYHELPETLPFSKQFMRKFQAQFLDEYFLSKERLLDVLPHQLKILSEDEMVQKYNSYLPADISSVKDILDFAGINEEELPLVGLIMEEQPAIAGLNEKLRAYFPVVPPESGALKVLLLDLSQHFSGSHMLYDLVEPPLGLMYLMTYLKQQLGGKVSGKIAKSRIDFDCFSELKALLKEFKPDLIGIRTLTLYKDFFHETVAMIRQWGVNVPLIAGGPYATSDFQTILQDRNVDLVVLGEGEITFTQLVTKVIENNSKLPRQEILMEIPGLGFVPDREAPENRFAREIIMLDQWQGELSLKPSNDLEPINTSANLAYTLFTSGSTGKPKGVMVEHRSIANLVAGLQQRIYSQYGPHQNVALMAPYSFDASVQQIFAILLQGHTLYLVPETIRVDGEGLIYFFQKENIDISDGTPTHIRLMVGSIEEETLTADIKHLIIGGEPLPLSLVESFFKRFKGTPPKITNIYGLTECCVDSTSYEIRHDNIDRCRTLPIGKPMANQQIYILNETGQPQPIGVPGELCIAGAGVGRGYLGQEVLTNEKFVADPFNPTANCSGKMYKTGDLSKWLPDGNIEFIGRIDHQVKIRGFRIELGEIENRILAYKSHNPAKGILKESFNRPPAPARPGEVRCTRCLLTSRFPGIHFDGSGVCNFCREFESYRHLSDLYFKSFGDFKALAQTVQDQRSGDYDCLLLYSGGKDSSYVLYRLVDLGLKVLAFTFDNGYISETALENIKRTTSRLQVDCIISTAAEMDKIFVESITADDTVCNGCFRALTTISTQLARQKSINMVVTGLSRGQILDTKLHGLLSQGVTEVSEIEQQLTSFRKIYHAMDDRIAKLLNIHFDDQVIDQIRFVDFFRYENTAVREIKEYLKLKDNYWKQPKDTGFCSTNCVINDVGIYVHKVRRGYHNYAAPLSWDCRLGLITREEGLAETKSAVDKEHVKGILDKLSFFAQQIKATVVIATEEETGERNLCAYLVSDEELDIADLKEYLLGHLPDYMVPTYFVQLEKLPVTANGKIDLKGLPDPKSDLKGGGAPIGESDVVETRLAALWADVLGIDKNIIHMDSNFFEIGGHSLRATILAARAHKLFNVKVTLAEMFKRPMIREMAQYISLVEKENYTAIAPAPLRKYYPLSAGQKRLYTLQQMDSGSTVYNVPGIAVLEGGMDKGRLEEVFRKLILRHDSLRTSIHFIDSEAVQKVHAAVEFNISQSVAATETPPEVIIEAFIRPFDLSDAPLMRVELVALAEEKHLLLTDIHHIVSDGESMGILIQDLMDIHAGRELPPLGLQYKDYCLWQKQREQEGAYAKMERYWLNQFAAPIPVLNLPTDYRRQAMQGFDGSSVEFAIGKEETQQLKDLAAAAGATLYIVTLSLCYVLLSKISGQEDIVLGTLVEGRGHDDLRSVMGMFVNTLALRNYPQTHLSFRSFLNRVKKQSLEAFENQDYQFDRLIAKLPINRETSRNPLFDVNLVFQNMEIPQMEIPGLKLTPHRYEDQSSKFDISFIVLEKEDALLFTIRYRTKLFKEETMTRYGKHFKEVIAEVLKNEDIELGEITILHELVTAQPTNVQADFVF